MELEVNRRQHGKCTVVGVGGEVDIHTARILREHLDELIENGHVHLIVDLSSVGFLDSTGLGALVATMKRVAVQQGSLRLVCATERILKVLRITGLTAVFPVFATLTEALADAGVAEVAGAIGDAE